MAASLTVYFALDHNTFYVTVPHATSYQHPQASQAKDLPELAMLIHTSMLSVFVMVSIPSPMTKGQGHHCV